MSQFWQSYGQRRFSGIPCSSSWPFYQSQIWPFPQPQCHVCWVSSGLMLMKLALEPVWPRCFSYTALTFLPREVTCIERIIKWQYFYSTEEWEPLHVVTNCIVLEIDFLEIEWWFWNWYPKKLTPFLSLAGKWGICIILEDKEHKMHNGLCPELVL